MPQPFHIVLYQPVIPQNTGSIARLCACTGAKLHLIHPLGFQTDAGSVRRAGLDYWEHVVIQEHQDWSSFQTRERPQSVFYFSKKAKQSFGSAVFSPGTYLVFGNETKGLPEEWQMSQADRFLQIPMRTHLVRSLNLAHAAAIVLYEALRQTDYNCM